MLRSLAASFSITRQGEGGVQAGAPLAFGLNPRSLDLKLPTVLDAPLSLSFVTKSVRFVDALMPPGSNPLLPGSDALDTYATDASKVLGGQPVADVQIPLPGPSLPGAIPPVTQINIAEALGIAVAEAVGVAVSTVAGVPNPVVVTPPSVTAPTVTVPNVTQTVQSIPVGGTVPTIGAPHLTPGTPAATDALSGVPGLLGRVVGTLPLLVSLPVSFTVRWKIIDEATNKEATAGQVQFLSGVDEPDLRLVFGPVFVEMTDLTTVPVARFKVTATVNLTLGDVSESVDLPGTTVLVPQVPVPTIAILYQAVNFGGYTLVFVPANSPLDPASNPRISTAQALDLLRGALAPLLSSQPPLAFFLNNIGAYFGGSSSVVMVKTDTLLNLQTVQFRGYDFFQDGFNFDGPRAEDVLSSLIFIGKPGKELHCFNARSNTTIQGSVVFVTGAEMIVKVPDLSQPFPTGAGTSQSTVTTIPAGRTDPLMFVAPTGQRMVAHDIRGFLGELSSLSFAG